MAKIRSGETDKSLLSLVWALLAGEGGGEGGAGALMDSRLLASPNQQAAQAQTIWYIDPSNSWTQGAWTPTSFQGATPGSGTASDANSGLTPETALLTFAQVVA